MHTLVLPVLKDKELRSQRTWLAQCRESQGDRLLLSGTPEDKGEPGVETKLPHSLGTDCLGTEQSNREKGGYPGVTGQPFHRLQGGFNSFNQIEA